MLPEKKVFKCTTSTHKKKNLTNFDEKISSSPRLQYFCDDILTSTLTLNFLHTFRTCAGTNRRSLFWYQRFNWCRGAEVRSISRRWGAEVGSISKRRGAEVGSRSRWWGVQHIKWNVVGLNRLLGRSLLVRLRIIIMHTSSQTFTVLAEQSFKYDDY